jgi:hypothetical protein
MSKVKNDREFPVEIKFNDDKGDEKTVTVGPGQEVEVPEEQSEAIERPQLVGRRCSWLRPGRGPPSWPRATTTR